MSALIYTLSMPGRNSWNGRWSGEDRIYAAIRRLPAGKKHEAKADRIIAGSPYRYRWPDGWCASFSVHRAKGRDVTAVRRKTNGFCGYDWMVDSIEADGDIYGPDQPKPTTPQPRTP